MADSKLTPPFSFVPLAKQQQDRTGRRYGLLVVLGHIGNCTYACKCDCGNYARVRGSNLHTSGVKSCGCLRHKQKHGQIRNPVYFVWDAMKQRCLNPRNKQFHNYGGRGIRLCDRWHDFANFYADMGERPDASYSLDRIDVHGHYEPGNCRWITSKAQANNMRKNVHVVVRGERLTLSECADRYGLKYNTVYSRHYDGWCDECLTLPSCRQRARCRHLATLDAETDKVREAAREGMVERLYPKTTQGESANAVIDAETPYGHGEAT